MEKSKNTVQERYRQWNDTLYYRYIESFNEDTTIWDGVVNPDVYAQSPLKVMFLNREAYDPDPENLPYDLCQAIRERIEKDDWVFPGQNTLRTHLKHYLTVLDMGQNGYQALSDDTVREHVQSADYYEFIRLFERVAYCNVKKSDGRPKSSKRDLREYAEKGLDTLKEQILFFNPSIILAGNVCEDILDNLFDWGDNLYCDPNHRLNIWQIKIGERLFPYVDMFHPSLVKGMSEYYIELLHALQVVEKEHPSFWQDRIEKTKNCFITQ
ncbi:MAG: hypothetical protein IKR69_03230 [Bacteroidales bacterium]|nr:hypothetical protein [Bacteroidales bacterium]